MGSRPPHCVELSTECPREPNRDLMRPPFPTCSKPTSCCLVCTRSTLFAHPGQREFAGTLHCVPLFCTARVHIICRSDAVAPSNCFPARNAHALQLLKLASEPFCTARSGVLS